MLVENQAPGKQQGNLTSLEWGTIRACWACETWPNRIQALIKAWPSSSQ